MSGLEVYTEGPGRFQEVRYLVTLETDNVTSKSREELADLVLALGRELLAYRDMTVDAESAARFFNRKRSWIYEAMSRPNTELQRSLSDVAAREPGGLLFLLSDLVRLRRTLFEER